MLNIRHIVGTVLLFVSGLVKLISECKNFYELEKGTHELCQQVCKQIFTWALEQIDNQLKDERDRSTWEVVGFRTKTAISTFGEFNFRRRLYRKKSQATSTLPGCHFRTEKFAPKFAPSSHWACKELQILQGI